MIGARKGSPLAVGHGEGEMYLGSDAIALAPMTDKITYLDEGDFVVLTRSSVEIRDASGQLANREMRTIQLDTTRVDKGGYKHFMAKEIAEQPHVIDDALQAYLKDGAITLPDTRRGTQLDFTQIDRLTIVPVAPICRDGREILV